MTLNGSGKLIDLNLPKVMGILNCTPDSFFDGGKFNSEEKIKHRIDELIAIKTDIIDIGGQSSKPNSTQLSAQKEWQNIVTAVEYIHKSYPNQLFSVDTFYSENVRKAADFGVSIINDISAGSIDPKMFKTMAQLNLPYVLMHMQGTPQNMQKNPNYDNIITELNAFFSQKIFQLHALGVKDILLDVGFGFGKTIAHNYKLLQNLALIGFNEYPLLAGLSRKSMIYKPLEILPNQALNGTTALHMIALQNGAKILRVHDVKQAQECIKLNQLLNS